MDVEPPAIVHRWLGMLGVRIPLSWVVQRLGTHPEYPSALSITDLLDELGLHNSAFVLDADQLDQLSQPFLAFIDDHKFIVAQCGRDLFKLRARWSGVAVLAEKPTEWMLPAAVAEDTHRQAQRNCIAAIAGLFGLSACLFAAVVLPSIQTIELLLCMSGMALSASYVMQTWGRHNVLAEKMCSHKGGMENSCSKLSNATPSLPLGLSMADLAIAFFAGLIAVHAVAAVLSISGLPLTTALTFLGLPATLYSLHIQRTRLKAWCGLCQSINAVIWILAALQFVRPTVGIAMSSGLVVLLFVFFVPGIVWMLIKSLVEENFAMRGKLIKLGQIHRDRELFLSYLFGQQPIEEPALPGDLRLGNSEARLQITAVLSFACDICGESFATLARLVRTHPHAIGVTVRFAVEHQPGSSKCKLLAQMLAHAIENRILDDGTKIERMIADWFSHKNFDLFLAQYPASDSTAIRASIDAQATWCKEAQIVSTPVLFINGYRLRRPYDVDDLPEHYAALVETVETMEEQPQAQPYSRAV